MWNYEAEEAKAVIVIVHGAMEYHGRYEALRKCGIISATTS